MPRSESQIQADIDLKQLELSALSQELENAKWQHFYLLDEITDIRDEDGNDKISRVSTIELTDTASNKRARDEAQTTHDTEKLRVIGKRYRAFYYVPRHDSDGTKGGNRPSILVKIDENLSRSILR